MKIPILNYLIRKRRIRQEILRQAKKKRQIIYGRRALNIQMPIRAMGAKTYDWDIYTRRPKRQAHKMQKKFDKIVNYDLFYSKPALHAGTHKVMHKGWDMKKGTEDDFGIIDYTQIPVNLKTIRFGGVKYERLSSIKKGKKRTLKKPEARYRWEKDKEDLRRIKTAQIMGKTR